MKTGSAKFLTSIGCTFLRRCHPRCMQVIFIRLSLFLKFRYAFVHLDRAHQKCLVVILSYAPILQANMLHNRQVFPHRYWLGRTFISSRDCAACWPEESAHTTK